MTPETKLRELERRAMVHLTRPLHAPELVDSIHASLIVLIWRYSAFEPYQRSSSIRDYASAKEQWRMLTEEVERLRLVWTRPC